MTDYDILHETIRIAFNAQHGLTETLPLKKGDALLAMAEKQNIYPLVYYGIGESCFGAKTFKATNRQIGAIYYVRKLAYLNVVSEMENSGIRTILLKGYTCANHYAIEHLRVSSDCDLLVLESDEERAYQVLKRLGYRCVEMRHGHYHHSVWRHVDIGIVELHTKLVEDDIDYVWKSVFDEVKLIDDRIRIETSEGVMYSLPPVEEWVFLFVHALKHFLQTGLSIQMLLDLYAVYNRLDKDQAGEALKRIENCSFGRLWAVFYAYVHKYGACVEDVANSEAMDIITQDLLNSGWLGLKENTRRVSLYEASNKEELTLQSWLLKAQTQFRRAFPEKRVLLRDYPAVQQKPWLLLICYTYRLIKKIKNRLIPTETEKINQQVRKAAKAERLHLIDRIMAACD